MSYKYDPYRDRFTHIDDEDSIVAMPVPTNSTWISPLSDAVTVEQHELTDDCIERIADAVVRKLKEVNQS